MDTRQALRRIQHYVAMRRAKPFLGLGDNVHNIHTGTEWEAELLFSDLCAVADAGAALATEDRAESELVEAAREEAKFLDELLVAIENAAADIGGSRPTDEILEDLGPANDALLEAIAEYSKR